MKIFVSYSRRDITTAKELLLVLNEHISIPIDSIFYDQHLVGGQKWWDVLMQNIRACNAFIFLYSLSSRESQYCRAELEYAIKLKKEIIPIDLSGDTIGLSSLDLDMYHAISYNDTKAILIENLEHAIANVSISRTSTRIPPPPLPADPLKEIANKIEKPEISPDEQDWIVAQVKKYLRKKNSDKEGALILLHRFLEYPDRLARVEQAALEIINEYNKEIDNIVAISVSKDRESSSSVKKDAPDYHKKLEDMIIAKLVELKNSDDLIAKDERRRRITYYAKCLSQLEDGDLNLLINNMLGTQDTVNSAIDLAFKFDEEPRLIFYAVELIRDAYPEIGDCLMGETYAVIARG